MSQNALSRELALRIGLAARALPDCSIQHLMTVITKLLGLPITEEKLATLNFRILKAEFPEVEEPLVKKAVHTLKHPVEEDVSDPNKPKIQAYQEGDIPNSIRIACASNDYATADGHFGSCQQFMIYQVSKDEARLIDIRDTAQADAVEDDKNRFRAELIKDCQVLYLVSIGGPAAAKIIKLGIHPIKLPKALSLTEVLTDLQTVLTGSPPPWLAKVMGISAEDRVKFAREDTEAVE